MVVTMLAARCPINGAYAGVRSMLVKRSRGPVAAWFCGDAKAKTAAKSPSLRANRAASSQKHIQKRRQSWYDAHGLDVLRSLAARANQSARSGAMRWRSRTAGP